MRYKSYRQRAHGGGRPFSIMARQRTVTQAVPREWLEAPRIVERTEFRIGQVHRVPVAVASYELQNNWCPLKSDKRNIDEILLDILSTGAALWSTKARYVLADDGQCEAPAVAPGQEPEHVTATGHRILIKDLKDDHLLNIIPKVRYSTRRFFYINEAKRRGLLPSNWTYGSPIDRRAA